MEFKKNVITVKQVAFLSGWTGKAAANGGGLSYYRP